MGFSGHWELTLGAVDCYQRFRDGNLDIVAEVWEEGIKTEFEDYFIHVTRIFLKCLEYKIKNRTQSVFSYCDSFCKITLFFKRGHAVFF